MNKYILYLCFFSTIHWSSTLTASYGVRNEDDQFQWFFTLPLELQVEICSKEAHNPQRFLQLNHELYEANKKIYLATWVDPKIIEQVRLALHPTKKIIKNSFLLQELDRPLAFDLITKLLRLSNNEHNNEFTSALRGILLHHIRTKKASYKDKIIELSRVSSDIQREAIQLLHDIQTERKPIIHSQNLPENYKENIHQAQFYSSSTTGNRKITTWVFPKTINLPKFNTLSLNGGEDIITLDEE